MITLFHQCLASIPQKEIEQFEGSFSIAEQLVAILKEKNLSIDVFAKIVGKKKSTVNSWLTGRHNFRNSTMRDIEHALNCKLS